jgi:excisionase family DNA binding protein
MSKIYCDTDEVVTRRNARIVAFFSSLERMMLGLERVVKLNKPSLNGERYLTDKELSATLKISRRTLQDWRNNGQINYVYLGGKVIYRESEVMKLLEKNFHKAWK